jgi:glycosyltransferase involved in cell wall biosynthesis
MPNVVLEAMAAGCALVATAVDGTSELIDHGVTGYLVPQGDIMAAAARLLDLSRSAELRSAMGSGGRAVVLDRYTVRGNTASHIRLYREIVNSRGVKE